MIGDLAFTSSPERLAGFEPAYTALQAATSPLGHRRKSGGGALTLGRIRATPPPRKRWSITRCGG